MRFFSTTDVLELWATLFLFVSMLIIDVYVYKVWLSCMKNTQYWINPGCQCGGFSMWLWEVWVISWRAAFICVGITRIHVHAFTTQLAHWLYAVVRSCTQSYAVIRSHTQDCAGMRSHTQARWGVASIFSTCGVSLRKAAQGCVRLRMAAYGGVLLRMSNKWLWFPRTTSYAKAY